MRINIVEILVVILGDVGDAVVWAAKNCHVCEKRVGGPLCDPLQMFLDGALDEFIHADSLPARNIGGL
jgi:hypothetical protein